MFKNLRTGTKLFLLCAMFVGAIILATYSLIQEKQIAIDFVRKELLGAQYLEALRGVYAVILADDAGASQGATQKQASVDAAVNALANAEAEIGASLHTAGLAENLATAVRELAAAGPGSEKRKLTVEALTTKRQTHLEGEIRAQKIRKVGAVLLASTADMRDVNIAVDITAKAIMATEYLGLRLSRGGNSSQVANYVR